jgi:hypothetical protein
MNTKSMKCELSVLKRASQKLYPAEIVDFNVVFDFYDVPRGELLRAHAQKIYDMTEDITWIGGWFDTIYGLYDVLSSLCNIVSSGTSLISAVSEAWTLFSISMDAFSGSISKPITIQGDRVVYGAQGGMSNLFSCDAPANKGLGCFVKKACDWVTCRNGATISEALFGFGVDDVPGMDVLVDVQNKMAETMCSPFAGENRIENWNFNIGQGSSATPASAVRSPGSAAAGANGG